MVRVNLSVQQRLPILGLMVCAMSLGGCGRNPEAQFAWRDSTRELLPDARRALQKSLVEQFGTPDKLVAWERMPVDYGGYRGAVAEPAEGAQPQPGQLPVVWNGAAPEQLAKGSPLLWLSGSDAGNSKQATEVTAFNHEQQLLTLASASEQPVGAEFVVNFGEQLQLGRMVYMRNCMHCHGVAGDGAGPTARYLNPLPRDYRLGIFKFTETLATEKVTRQDLWRVVKYGIPGTYMPSFLLLDDKETVAVIEYIRWLAMRGELEKRMGDELTDFSLSAITSDFERARNSYAAAVAAGEKPETVPNRTALMNAAKKESQEYLAEEYGETIDGTADFIAENWVRAEDPASIITPSVPRVADTAASRANGRLLYLSDKTKCYTCHGVTGRGNGAAVEDYWPKPGSTEKYSERGLHDVWGHVLPPRNLRLGQYRGGRRPIDVFRRIYAGIKGTPMPAFGGTVLKDEEVWDVVNFVMSLPFESEDSMVPVAKPQLAARPVQ